jgi:hypothetical protein
MGMRRKSRRLLCVLLGATTLGLVGAVPANAVGIGTMSAHLTVIKANPPSGDYFVHVGGTVKVLLPTTAEYLINKGYKIMWRLKAADKFSNPVQLNWRTSPNFVTSQAALRYSHTERVHRSFVNEDDSIFDRRDELFAEVNVVYPGGTPATNVAQGRSTNLVVGYF